MVSIISKFVKAFSCTFYYYTKQIKILSFKCQTHYQAVVTQSAPTIISDIFEKSFGLKRSCVNCYLVLFLGLIVSLFYFSYHSFVIDCGFVLKCTCQKEAIKN